MSSITIQLTEDQLRQLHPIQCELWERGENCAVLAQVSFHHDGVVLCTVIDGDKARKIQGIMGVVKGKTDEKWGKR